MLWEASQSNVTGGPAVQDGWSPGGGRNVEILRGGRYKILGRRNDESNIERRKWKELTERDVVFPDLQAEKGNGNAALCRRLALL